MSKNEKTIEIKIEGKEWENCLNKAYSKANKKVKIDGFRPGKAPKEIFLKRYGIESLYNEASNYAVDIAYTKMLKENKEDAEKMVAYPSIKVNDVNEKDITFEFTLTLKPTVKLGKYKSLGIKKEEVKVTKEEIETGVKNILNRYAEDIVKEGKIKKGDIADINYEGFVDGKAFEGGKAKNHPLKIGSGQFIPGFEDQLIGLKAGEDKTIEVTFPKDYHAENLKGKKAKFEVHINEVKEVKLPEFNDEFFEDLAMENVKSKEDLYKEIEENIKKHKDMHAEDEYLEKLLEKASENVEVDIPNVMIDEEVERMYKRFENQVKSNGMNLDMYYKLTNTNEETLKTEMRKNAQRNVKDRLMLEAIMEKEKIEASDEEANKEAEKMAKNYGVSKEELIMNFGGLETIKYDVKMKKAIDLMKK